MLANLVMTVAVAIGAVIRPRRYFPNPSTTPGSTLAGGTT